jgi:hypothetical protein
MTLEIETEIETRSISWRPPGFTSKNTYNAIHIMQYNTYNAIHIMQYKKRNWQDRSQLRYQQPHV